MSYYTTGIGISRITEHDLGVVIRAITTHEDKAVQCYVSGELQAWRQPVNGAVGFRLQQLRPTDVILLLAVDVEDAETDYWADAFPEAPSSGNRVKVRTPQIPWLGLNCTWRVHRGNAGDSDAALLVHEQEFYPGNRRALGYGTAYGSHYGYDGEDSKGYGYCYGHVYGFDCGSLMWLSEPLPPGTYPIRVVIADAHGNESANTTDSVTLNTYGRPASGLTVDSYNKDTDTLSLSWTASEDI